MNHLFTMLDRPRHSASRSPRPTFGALVLLFGLVLLLSGCGALKSRQTDLPKTGSESGAASDLASPPQPQWRTTGEALGLSEPAKDPVPLGEAEPGYEPYSLDPVELRSQVAVRCGSARMNQEEDFLSPLVTDLYLSGVDPAFATEALILGDCGPLAVVVRELVAQGGDQVVASVVNRALFLTGPGAARIIESAASSGLERNVAGLGERPGGAANRGDSLSYAMAYFPFRGQSASLETADAVNTLYSNATPGYGIYTFVLLGAGFDAQSEAEQARYWELLRVIETYVLAADEGTRGPSTESHAFLVAVHPETGEDNLADQTSPELSDPIRRDLIRYLRRDGRAALAERLETRPGPFLVSSLEPRLLPTSAVSPRLVTDLSAIGSEYMYAVVDAYDRPVPLQSRGRPDALEPIRERLLGLFTRRVPQQDLPATIKDAWVFRIGRWDGGGGVVATAPDGARAPGAAPADQSTEASNP